MKKIIVAGIITCLILALIALFLFPLFQKSDNQSQAGNQPSQSSLSTNNHTHIWSEWTTDTEPTCTTNGLKIRFCECGETDEITYAALGHSLGEWTVTNEPQCDIEGIKERICSECEYKETEDIPALSHTEGGWIISNNEKHFLCVYCNQFIRNEQIIISEGLKIENGVVISLGNCSSTEIAIPSTYDNMVVSIISSQAFEYERITSAILPDSITMIGENAFYQCFQLSGIHLGNNISTIGKRAFFKCTSLKSVRLPNSLTELGEYTFAYCSDLESVYIGNHITKLKIRVFQDCKSLSDIYYSGTIAEWNLIEKDSEWDLGTPDYTVHCTDGDIEK